MSLSQPRLRPGHDVPECVVRRRYVAGRRNFERTFKGLVSAWAHYDNSGEHPVLIEEGHNR